MKKRDQDDHVAVGNDVGQLRWIEAGRVRIDEDTDGGHVSIKAPGSDGPTWLSATELVGLMRHLAGWFAEDPSEAIREIEARASHVRTALEAWNDRARIDEEHPPYDELTRSLDEVIGTCRRLREVGLLSERPEKTRDGASPDRVDRLTTRQLLALLRDDDAVRHPGFAAFCRQQELRGSSYEQRVNDAWAAFKRGWDGNLED